MRAVLPRLCAALPLALLAGCGDGSTGDKIALRFHPPAGAAYGYALEQQMTMKFTGGPMAQMGEQEMTTRVFFTQAIEGPADGGGIAVTMTYDSTQMEAPMLPAAMMDAALLQMRGMKGRFVFDDRMRVLSASVTPPAGMDPQMAEQLRNATKGFAFPLPAGPVGRGDRWTERVELPVGQLPGTTGPIHATTALTVKEVRIAGADTTVLLGVETTLPGDPIPIDMQGQKATIRLSGKITGDQLYSVSKGAVVAADMSGTMRVDMAGGAMGDMAMTMEQRVKVRLTREQ